MKFIVLNTKGGSTKSTTATQVLVPYLYQKNDENSIIKLIEFDDENSDSETYTNTKIFSAERIKISGNDLTSSLINTIVKNDNIIIDVGGNKTTTYIIDTLEKTDLLSLINCVVIPLTDGEQDCINAVNVYKKIREINKEIKIIFALGRIDKTMDINVQFINFYGDVKDRFDSRDGLINSIDQNDRNVIKIYNDEAIMVSRLYGFTAFELASQNLDNLNKKRDDYILKNDLNSVAKISYMVYDVKNAKKFKDEVLSKCFQKIDEVMDN